MTEQIEVPVRAEIPLSKYLARIPKALFLKSRSHCDRKGLRNVHSLKLELDSTEAQAQLHELQRVIDEQTTFTNRIGTLDSMTRDRAREILVEAGATVAGSVSKKTSAMLLGHSYNGEKLTAAEARMLPVWTELQFLHMAKFIGADVRIPE